MGYFDEWTATAFKKDASGNAVYFPRGASGPGYVIESEERRKRIWSHRKKNMMVSIAVILPLIITIGIVVMIWFRDTAKIDYLFLCFILFPFIYAWDRYDEKKLTQGLPITTEDLHFIEIPLSKTSFKWDRQRRSLVRKALLIIFISALGGATIKFAILFIPSGIPFPLILIHAFLGFFEGLWVGIVAALLWCGFVEGGRWWRVRKAESGSGVEGAGLLLCLMASLLFVALLPLLSI